MEGLLADRAARVLGSSAEKVNAGVPLTDMGFDSLMAVELQTVVSRDFGVALPLAALLEGGTVADLATRVVDQLALDTAGPAAVGTPAAEPQTQVDAVPDATATSASTAPTGVPPREESDNGAKAPSDNGAASGRGAEPPSGARLSAPEGPGPARVTDARDLPQTRAPHDNGHGEAQPAGSDSATNGRGSSGADYGSLDYSRWTPMQRFVQRTLSGLLRLVARVEVTGLENIPRSGPVLIAINHLSMIDVVLMLTLLPRRAICFAADRLSKVPVVRWFLNLGDSIYVRRGEADQEAIAEGLTVLRSGGMLGLAPEGTRSRTGGLSRARSGIAYLAAEAPAPILPVAACGQERIPHNLKRFRRSRVQVRIGPLIHVDPGGRTAATLQRDADRVLEAIAAMLPPDYRGVYADAHDPNGLTSVQQAGD
jgi:1-acyl-sn-glycerol-3-phosphate acyltransferase